MMCTRGMTVNFVNSDIASYCFYTKSDYVRIYRYWKNNENKKIYLYFLKRRLTQIIRKIKKKVL